MLFIFICLEHRKKTIKPLSFLWIRITKTCRSYKQPTTLNFHKTPSNLVFPSLFPKYFHSTTHCSTVSDLGFKLGIFYLSLLQRSTASRQRETSNNIRHGQFPSDMSSDKRSGPILNTTLEKSVSIKQKIKQAMLRSMLAAFQPSNMS